MVELQLFWVHWMVRALLRIIEQFHTSSLDPTSYGLILLPSCCLPPTSEVRIFSDG